MKSQYKLHLNKTKYVGPNDRIRKWAFDLLLATGFLFVLVVLLTACRLTGTVLTHESPTQLEAEPTVTETIEEAGVVKTLPPPEITVINTTLPVVRSTTAPAPTPSFTSGPTNTPDPYAELTIDHLVKRSYGGGEVKIEEVLAENSYFTRTLISYPSDGLTIYGFMDTPRRSAPPYPVVIAVHGYIDPSIYATVDYTTRYADALARAGFLVLHPNLRGYPPSDEGPDLFRVGMAVDVLNLIGIVKDQGGEPGPLEMADPNAIGLWGHSMGGGISVRVMTVSPDVQAVVLYGAMSGDERKNFERIFGYFSDGERGREELLAPDEAFLRISPIYYLDRVQAAISIHHGEKDGEVPLAWSLDLCQNLRDLGKSVECYTYAGQEHTFSGDGDALFVQRMIQFLDQKLRGR